MSEEKNGESGSQKEQTEKPKLNEEQYKLLLSCSKKKEVTEWNKYRMEHTGEEIRLQGAKLERTNLQGAVLWNANLQGAHLGGANLQGAHLEGANLQGAHLEGANLQDADFEEANLQGAKLQRAKLQGANFRMAIVDGGTLIWNCDVNHWRKSGRFTDFQGVGLDNARITPETKQLIEYNIRRKNWEKWYSKHFLLKGPAWLFWLVSDYGLSTWRIIVSCILLVFTFAAIYFIWGCVDYYHGIKIEPGIVKGFFITPQPEQMSDFYYGSMIFLRSVCLSIAMMFTFGDISVINTQFGWKWWFSHSIPILQMVLGYMVLGALITRLAILFTSGGPAGKFAKTDGG